MIRQVKDTAMICPQVGFQKSACFMISIYLIKKKGLLRSKAKVHLHFLKEFRNYLNPKIKLKKK